MPKKQSSLNGWYQVKRRGRDDDQIEEDRKKALEAKKQKRLLKSPVSSTSSKGKAKGKAKGKTMAKIKATTTAKKKSAAAVTRGRGRKYGSSTTTSSNSGSTRNTRSKNKSSMARRKNNNTNNKYDSDDDDAASADSFVVDDDYEDESDADQEEEEFQQGSSSEDEELELTDSPLPAKRKSRRGNKSTTKTSSVDAGFQSTDDDDDDSENSSVADDDDNYKDNDEDDDDDEDEDDVLIVDKDANENSDSDSDEGGTFLISRKARPSKPSKELRKASVAAKTRHNPALVASSITTSNKARAIAALVDFTKASPPPSSSSDAIKLRTPSLSSSSTATASRRNRGNSRSLHQPTPPSGQTTTTPRPTRNNRSSSRNITAAYSDGSDFGTPTQPATSRYFTTQKSSTNTKQQGQKALTGFKRKCSVNVDLSDDDSSINGDRNEKPKTTAVRPLFDGLVDSPEPTPQKARKPAATKKKRLVKKPKYTISDSEDESPEVMSGQGLDVTKNRNVSSRGKVQKCVDDDDGMEENSFLKDDDDESLNGGRSVAKKQKNRQHGTNVDERNSSTRNGKLHIQDEEDEFSDSMDEDERVALQFALKESKKESKKTKTKTNNDNGYDDTYDDNRNFRKGKSSTMKMYNSDNDQQLVDEILGETSDEGEEDLGEEYEEEKKAATSVLHTAEALSAQVLHNMSTWMNEKDSSGSATKGIIVDGAIALGDVQRKIMAGSQSSNGSSTDNKRHRWISQEEMHSACPDVKLSTYQLIGVNWLALLHGMKCNIEGKRDTNVNGILADEMGLGKTVQTIAFLAWLKYKRTVGSGVMDNDSDDGASVIEEASWPHIIIVPVSVLPNWEREFKTFCPDMNVVKYHGSLTERAEIQEDLRRYLPQTKPIDPALDVILVPATIYQKEKSDDRRFLNKFRFDYMVVDEAHMLKNAQSTRYKMLSKVSTRHRLLLTGTPVQNSPQELLNMLCFLMPLFSRSKGGPQSDENDSPRDRMLQHFVDEKMMEKNGDEQFAYQKLKKLFAPFVLRRKKIDVISQLLPKKEHVVEFVELDKAARAVYDNILAAHVNKNGMKLTAAIGDHLFTNLRKAAHHPLLLRTRHTSPAEVRHLNECFHKYNAFQGEGSTLERVGEEVSKFNDFHIHVTALELIEENRHRRSDLDRYVLEEDALFSSAKFTRLRTLLPKLISDGHRILIFSVWTSCLDLLGCLMEYLHIEYLRMDGSCPASTRQELIDKFNSDDTIPVFLLSTKACGLGINLTAADTCIIHDLDFNPFNDLQAEDRCHRIGQKKKVTVYKLVTEDTVDADVFEMQERKAKMNAAIMESKSDKSERKEMMKAAVDRFMSSPQKKASKKKKDDRKTVVSQKSDKECNKEVVSIL